MIPEDILSKKQFSELVEYVAREKRMSHMDAVLYVCEQRMVDPEEDGYDRYRLPYSPV